MCLLGTSSFVFIIWRAPFTIRGFLFGLFFQSKRYLSIFLLSSFISRKITFSAANTSKKSHFRHRKSVKNHIFGIFLAFPAIFCHQVIRYIIGTIDIFGKDGGKIVFRGK